MSTFGLIGLTFLCAGLAFLVLVTRIGHPHHRRIALSIYALGWVPFLVSVWRHRQFLTVRKTAIEGLLYGYEIHVAALVVLVLLGAVAKVLFPLEDSPFERMDDDELTAQLAADLSQLRFVDEVMQRRVDALCQNAILEKSAADLAPQDVAWLREWWTQFLELNIDLDVLKTRYRTFFRIDRTRRATLHAQAFLVAYGAYVSQYRAELLLCVAVRKRDPVQTLLNEALPKAGVPEGGLAAIQKRSMAPDTLVRLNVGRAYLKLVSRRLDGAETLYGAVRARLGDIDQVVDESPKVFIDNPLRYLERRAFRAWFPLQKRIAIEMSHLRTTSRSYFITARHIAEHADRLEPGDILLQRREWHMTNLGIPGYWTHAALYLGTLKHLDDHFADLPELGGQRASERLEAVSPAAHAALGARDDKGHPHSVIEALGPGVIITSLEHSGGADALAVLRPRVTLAERLRGVLAAVVHLGKPYDYNFDFTTDNALVCSQLVYMAYRDADGFNLQPESLNGRLLLPPNEIARKFDADLACGASEMDLVLFLDGMDVGAAVAQDEAAFRESWRRPKWHIVFS